MNSELTDVRKEMNLGFRDLRLAIERQAERDAEAHDSLDRRLRWVERAVYGGALLAAAYLKFGSPSVIG